MDGHLADFPVKAAILKAALPYLLGIEEVHKQVTASFPECFANGKPVPMAPDKQMAVLGVAVSTAMELAKETKNFEQFVADGNAGRLFCMIFALAYTTADKRGAGEPVHEYLLALRDTSTRLDNIASVLGPLTPVCRQIIMMAMQDRHIGLGDAQQHASRKGFRVV